ncbi:sensor histidine kinase [Candidatus Riflebacteria bacterium]
MAKRKILFLISLIFFLSLAHFLCDPHNHIIHEFLFKITYLPIILGGIWFGWKAGLIIAFCTSLIYLFHIQIQLSAHSHFFGVGIYLELFLYHLLGFITGFLSSLQKKTLEELEEAKLETEKSYCDLMQKTRDVLSLEKELEHSQRLQLMGEMVAGLAHEIRTPLMSIYGSIEALKKTELKEEEKKEFLTIIEEGTERINRFVNDFLDLAGKEPRLKEVEIKSLVTETLKLFKHQVNEKNIKLDLNYELEKEVFETDVSLFQQVLGNILLNAIQASTDGGQIKICILMKAKEGVSILIRDNGSGVPEEISKKIFEPFFSTKKDGRGLGLSICKRIMNNLKGKLEVDRVEEGKGVLFKLWLPIE